jgi:hypothetical protein
MQMRGSPSNTASALQRAMQIAEVQHKTSERPQTTPEYVDLRPNEIEMRPELFQPREFSFGAKDVDKHYVKKLAGEIETAGELDPILVIRLGVTWVCVDGHHRVRAYQKVRWRGTIKCEWFGGSVREAVDEGMRRNRTVKLEVPRADRQEQAWKRTLLELGSKSEVVRLCGVSEGIVAMMRRVKALANAQTEEGKAFRQRLDAPITEKSWSLAKLAYIGAEQTKMDIEARAGQLAREISARLESRLSKDPEVTARALAIYDPELPTPLTMALLATRENGRDENGSAVPITELRGNAAAAEIERRQQTPREDLERQRAWLSEGLQRVEAELARRERVSDSDLVWQSCLPASDSDDSEATDAPLGP